MAEDNLGGGQDIPQEIVDLLTSKKEEIQKAIHEILGIPLTDQEYDAGYTYFFSLAHDESGSAIYSGNGCPACAASRALRWCVENDIRHNETGMPLVAMAIPVPNKRFRKTPKKDTH